MRFLRKIAKRLATEHRDAVRVHVFGDAAVLGTLAIEIAHDVFTFGLIAGCVVLLFLLLT